MLTNKRTDKQTPLKTSTVLRYATPVGNYEFQKMFSDDANGSP